MRWILLIFLLSATGYAQSIAIQKAVKFDPQLQLPQEMSWQEFQDVQREITWERVAIAGFTPGYLHFYAAQKKWAYSIASVRLLGMGMIVWGVVDQLKFADNLSFSVAHFLPTENEEKKRTYRNLGLVLAGMALNMMGFALDWAHADWIIEKRRNAVLYKYGWIKKVTAATDFTQNGTPFLCVRINW